MLLGWLCARIRVLDEPRLTQSLGTLVMKVMLPSFVVYRVGIKMDLLQPENWLALSCFVLWTALLHGATLAYCWLLRRRDLGEAGFVGLLLTANNYGVSGFAMMAATFGAVGAELSLLTGEPLAS